MTLIFRGVEVSRDWNGKLKGNLNVQGDNGRMALNLTEDLCEKILLLCADNIVEAAQEVAEDFRREALQIGTINGKEIASK